MSENLTIEKLRELLSDSGNLLQTLPERRHVSSETDALFDKLAQEYYYMFSYIIDYLDQNHLPYRCLLLPQS